MGAPNLKLSMTGFILKFTRLGIEPLVMTGRPSHYTQDTVARMEREI